MNDLNQRLKSRHHHQHHSKTRSQCYSTAFIYPAKKISNLNRTTWDKIKKKLVTHKWCFFYLPWQWSLTLFWSCLYLLNHLLHSNSNMARERKMKKWKSIFILLVFIWCSIVVVFGRKFESLIVCWFLLWMHRI